MSLINYIEPTNIGAVFAGIGSLIMVGISMYIFYRIYIKFCQWFDVIINRDTKYLLIEDVVLNKIAKEKGIDLDKELIKREMLRDVSKKSVRRKIEEQIYNELFKDKKE